MSDIMGNIIEMSIDDNPDGAWISGENGPNVQRSLKEPNLYEQPVYFWDLYFVPNVTKATKDNDNGGVHTNSSLLNIISRRLSEAGMSVDDQCYYWMNVALAMTPRTDFAQMAEILPWCARSSGYAQYEDAVRKALEETGYGDRELPDSAGEGKAIITFTYIAPQEYEEYDPIVTLFTVGGNGQRFETWPEGGTGKVAAVVPEGEYAMTLTLTGNESEDVLYYLYGEDGWESDSRDELTDRLGSLDMENIIEAGSGAKKELQGPQW